MTGDGTTTTVLLIRELYIGDGLIRGLKVMIRLASRRCRIWTRCWFRLRPTSRICWARKVTSVQPQVVELLTKVCVIALRTEVDLQMIEKMELQHKSMPDTQLVRRVVLVYRSCHPDRPM
uniref:T-complex protein 1 subunit zeta n=1 Tax=Culex pipiens TaxID=7175 RepID=A0A8D8JQ28_CULPI